MKKLLLIIVTIFILNTGVSLASTFNVSLMPGTVLPTSLLKGQTATAYYIVQNNTQIPQKAIQIRYLPLNVKQVTSGGVHYNTCTVYSDVPASERCVVQLTIFGAVDSNDPNPKHHLMVCQGESDCRGVDDKKDELNVTEGKANTLARVTVVKENGKAIAYTSLDGGIGWAPHNIGATGFIRGVACNDKNGKYCVAVGDLFRQNTPDGRNPSTVFFSYTSSDGGISWVSHNLGQYGGVSALHAITCNGRNAEHCVTVGGYSKPSGEGPAPIVYTSTDSGVNWASHFLVPQKLCQLALNFDPLLALKIDPSNHLKISYFSC